VAYRGVGVGLGCSTPPRPRNSEGPPKSCQTQPDRENCSKLLNLGSQHPKMLGKKCSKILKLPPVCNCFTLAMANRLVVIINSLEVPIIKKILLYEMEFLAPNYSCLQNHWLRGYPHPPNPPSPLSSNKYLQPPPRPKTPSSPPCPPRNWLAPPPPRTKFLGASLPGRDRQCLT